MSPTATVLDAATEHLPSLLHPADSIASYPRFDLPGPLFSPWQTGLRVQRCPRREEQIQCAGSYWNDVRDRSVEPDLFWSGDYQDHEREETPR